MSRSGMRNGYKPRTLITRVGRITLAVPQARDGSFSTKIFDRYQRTEKALVLTLMEMYLKGVSTRKVAAVTEKLCCVELSSSLVSDLSKNLDHEVMAWKKRRLGCYPYVRVDARYEKVRTPLGVVSQGVLITTGVRTDGRREVPDVSLANSENKASYEEVFSSLKDRGLHGVKLVISDAHKGLKGAIARHFQGASWQRCQLHFTRDQVSKVSYKHRAALTEDLRAIFAETTREHAIAKANEVA